MHAPAPISTAAAHSSTKMPAPLPANEAQRLEALHALNLLDTPPEERFDRITRLAARVLNVPISCVVLIDEKRDFFKSHYGSSVREMSREDSILPLRHLGKQADGHSRCQDG